MLPVMFRVAVLLVRGLRLLLARLFGEAGAIGGGRVAAAVVLAGVVILVLGVAETARPQRWRWIGQTVSRAEIHAKAVVGQASLSGRCEPPACDNQ